LAVEKLAPIAAEAIRLQADQIYVDSDLASGAQRARAIAGPIVRDVREIVGFLVS
jgi:tryptophanyl-tRNA synthetase